MKKTLALMTMMSAFAATPALAENVPFNAVVSSTCTIDGINAGTLGVNGDASVLSSTLGGGNAGTANVTANSNLFTLTVTDPTAWSSGPAAPTSTTWVSSTNFNGNTFGAGVSQTVPAATTPVSVDLTVTAGSGSFANGTYSAMVVLTCS